MENSFLGRFKFEDTCGAFMGNILVLLLLIGFDGNKLLVSIESLSLFMAGIAIEVFSLSICEKEDNDNIVKKNNKKYNLIS
tara:strand:+ start:7602 stop:7844 length:243 start_codon:yes stop_codon:yes gene_type:complete